MAEIQINLVKEKVLQFAATFDACCCLDSNNYNDPYSEYDCLIAFGIENEINLKSGAAFNQFKDFYELHKNWMFGLFSYELKNEIEALTSQNSDSLDFPDLFFFVPKYLIAFQGNTANVLIGEKSILGEIEKVGLNEKVLKNTLEIEPKIAKANYINIVEKLHEHIHRGDIYEVNFCQEFFARHAEIDPLSVYKELNKLSPTPFAGYFKIYDHYILSATPERFLRKLDNQLISQPIKGTARRSLNAEMDAQIKNDLRVSAKEQAENVMIVDLVRNDLTKSAVRGSVKVDELFGIYSFPQVHQMISTISCELSPDIHFITAIKNTFPIGSMTGAPKLRAMQLIDEYEESKRGAFSGSFGYINPQGDFDFNVIIRSILYNSSNQYLSFQVGSAITYQSDAEKEYEECLLKASAMVQVLTGS